MAWFTLGRLRLVVAGATLAACTHGAVRTDEAAPSLVLRDVFFTNVLTPAGRTYTTTYELGPRLRRFHPDRDQTLVLVAVFDPRYTVNVRAALFRPDGRQHGMFEQRLDGRPEGTWRTVRRFWSIDSLRPWPGEWYVKLWVDDRPMGQYFFVLAPRSAQQQIMLGRETSSSATTELYPEVVKAHIRSKWGYPCVPNPTTTACEYKDATVVLQFGIRKDGTLAFVKVLKASGYATYDEHAVETVRRSAPFPPIPDSVSLTGIPIDATMNYVVGQEPPK